MDTLLRTLFDYQRFAPNALLSELIADTQSRYSHTGHRKELTDDEAGLVAAAGAPEVTVLDAGRKDPFAEDTLWTK